MARGYAVVESGGHVYSSARGARVGDSVNIRLKDGSISATVTEVKEK